MSRKARHLLPAVVREWILDELERIECEHDVVVLYACESGSRAWSFALPNSDYDTRFVYMHQLEQYQRIEEPRDVIGRSLNDELGISGWELHRALRLMRRSDPALLEWFGSPLVYREEPGMREELLRLGGVPHSIPGSRHHYLPVAHKSYRGYLRGDNVWLKKHLYVLRPLFVVRWLDAGLGLPPVTFERLVEVTLDDPSLHEELDALLNLKCRRDESAYGPPRLAPQCLIEAELLQAERGAIQPTDAHQDNRLLDRYFHDKTWQYTRETS